ncbi:MAG: complex I NDUFA9 subunit family protein [Rhodospirillaceae bacterium]
MIGRNRVITVFGGSGFIGRHLVRRLAKLEQTTVLVACRNPGRAAFLKPAGDIGQIIPMGVDISSDDSVARVVSGADVVINLIGILYESGRWTFQAAHTEAAERIARAAKAAGAERLVQISAIGADRNSASAYARTKALGELAVRQAFPEATVVRPSIVFGPEDNFFNRFATMARILPFLPLIGGGHTRFQPVYVGDVADAIMAILRDGATAGRDYELGGPAVYSFRQLMSLVMAEIRRTRTLVSIPWRLAYLQATILEKLPCPLLTRDQLELLKKDNLVDPEAPGLRDLGITPTAVEVVIPTYLHRFRPGGDYSRSAHAR